MTAGTPYAPPRITHDPDEVIAHAGPIRVLRTGS